MYCFSFSFLCTRIRIYFRFFFFFFLLLFIPQKVYEGLIHHKIYLTTNLPPSCFFVCLCVCIRRFFVFSPLLYFYPKSSMIVVTWSTTERREIRSKSTARIRIIQTSSGNVNFHYTSLLQLHRYKSTAHWYNPNFFGKCKFPLGIFLFIFIGTNPSLVGIIQTSSGNVNFHFSIFLHLHRYKSTACWYNPNFLGKCKFPLCIFYSSS